ncbi:probable serine/threonine-protein kinase PBL7 isoform X1 [Quercus suber]|uniref:probable serine/threonine-protein kinase PBL7 isoform X1 n=1 Tax=Quercus suber TaxID=58331 RepID=UPI0032E043D7
MGLADKKRSASAMQKIYDDILSTTYKVLSTMLHDQTFFFGDRPTSLDALFLGHALFVLHVLPEGSVLFAKLNGYPNLVNYTVNHGQEVLNVEPQLMSEISSSRSRPSKLFKNYQLRYFTNFDKKELIGCGAFGNVYRGCMWGLKNPIINSKLIAVKVSHHNRGDIFKQWQVSNQFFYIPYMSVYIHNDTIFYFQAEIQFGSSLQHKNFIKILGHYRDEEKLYLVYEYMKRGHLGRCYQVLDWAEMIKIARGIALAVEYMHKLDPPLTNRDLKLNNILLDEDLNPKVSDFGMVTIDGVEDASVGTLGFVDEAVNQKSLATIKTDMHNVGVILLLLITKQPYMEKQILIGDRAMKQFKEGKECGIVVHETLKETGCNEERATLIIKTALQCLDFSDARPSIGQVVQILHDL